MDQAEKDYQLKRDRTGMYLVLIVLTLLLIAWVQFEQYRVMVKRYNLEAFNVAAPADPELPRF